MGLPVIAILGGTGALGGGLAARWARAGYRIVIGSRSPQKACEAAQAIARDQGLQQLHGVTNEAAAAAGDVVVLAVPFAHQEGVLRQVRTALAGKILLTAAVPLAPPQIRKVHLPPEGSAARAAQDTLGAAVRVVSAFQNVSAGLLAGAGTVACEVLVTGDDAAARRTVIALVEAIGLRAWDAGPLANSVAAEALTPVLLHINKSHGFAGAGIRISPGRPVSNKTGKARAPKRVTYVGLPNVPHVRHGDDLAKIIVQALEDAGETLADDDILIVAQKIVSKAEGRFVRLREVTPSENARRLSAEVELDARLVELILSESTEVVAQRRGLLIVAHRLGLVLANAGIDRSNVGADWEDEVVLLLPRDPDHTAAGILRNCVPRAVPTSE